ncbi:solute carrier family 25 member 35-like [Anthonomus grandis grandis]|uniref:solute carrier family 25 member 35-like n=1 Tax=Anthonomus grandis grandis TaxID=2921223 RepID=UPI00216555E7|nr:solute carrier family 25 member 35-like [Anthonomus grandis grandis]XP_050310745.1 solute carrier family 25 member 35-like [Anthonomus grandis grandis]XP_050310746.1 solute carrier family 25 member 35-like [Anthonomus grandis grandis]XP_050310747.1 solute carrier family 25 member 35-like [Anthonomus grandis grandis]
MEFAIGGTAAMAACLFTNPLEVLKTRMQLQGELKAKGHAVHYKNVFHAGYVVAKNEGVLALQKGLVPGLWVQLFLNGARLGVYGVADSSGYLKDEKGDVRFFRTLTIVGAGAMLGNYLASPLFLVKTQLQSQANKAIAVGHQHKITGTFQALIDIYKANGVKGLFRGSLSTLPRAFVGGSTQLLFFDYTKQFLNKFNVTESPLLKSFIASMVGGVGISVMMNPFDLIMTRLYNQPIDASGKGLLYHSYFDCVKKIIKSEGVLAFYKGIGPTYFRLGPHTVLCLVFFDELRNLVDKYLPHEKKIQNV